MSELYDRADNMFGELVIPESFSEALSYAEQLIWLYLHKQNELIEGENITITDNGDGTVTISASVDGVKGIDRIESTVETDKTVVVIYYTDGTHQSFNVLAGPQGPQGIPGQDGAPGVQGDPGLGIKSIVVTNVETATVEVKGTRINPDESSVSQTFQKQMPKRSVLTITYDDDTTDTVYAYAGASTYVGETIRNLSVTPNTHTIKFKMYNPADGMVSSLQDVTIADGAQGPQGVPGQDGTDGQDGAPGATGATPNITMTASVLPTAGVPDVQISKTGTDENPAFALLFSGLKGENGQNGVGVPTGGTEDQMLVKNSGTDYDTKWDNSLSGIISLIVSRGSSTWDTWRRDGGSPTIVSDGTYIGLDLFCGTKGGTSHSDSNCGYIKNLNVEFRTFNIVSDLSAGDALGSIEVVSNYNLSPVLGSGKLFVSGTGFTTILSNGIGWLILTDSNSNVITVPVCINYRHWIQSYDASTHYYSYKYRIDLVLATPLKAGTYTSAQLRR